MLELTCDNFIDVLASKAPVPGGGGAAAYVGALGTALGSMVGNLTLGKKKYEDVQEDILKLLNRSEVLIDQFKNLVEKDAEVFLPLSQVYGLPQSTEEEKRAKETALQHALIAATEIPLKIARCCVSAIELHAEYAKKGTRIAISDVGVGVIFCKAALQGAKFNVLINTKIMKDQERKSKIEVELNELESIGLEKADRICQEVEALLKA
jgi:formiminotetrahydrofolate cyclodeaminase